MTTPSNPDIKSNLKEATDLLSCMNVNEEKLQRIIDAISSKIKEDPSIKKIIELIRDSFDEQEAKQELPALQKLLEHDDILSLIEQILSRLGNNQEIVENIEKKVLPILFSR